MFFQLYNWDYLNNYVLTDYLTGNHDMMCLFLPKCNLFLGVNIHIRACSGLPVMYILK